MRFLLVLGDDDNTYQIRFESRPRRAAIACGFTVCRCEADSERRHIDWAAAPVPQRAGHRTTRRRGRRARSRSWLPRSGPASARRGAALPVPLGARAARSDDDGLGGDRTAARERKEADAGRTRARPLAHLPLRSPSPIALAMAHGPIGRTTDRRGAHQRPAVARTV